MEARLDMVADGAERAVRIVGEVAAWLGLGLVLVVAGNVIARYFLGLSSVGMQEIEWHIMAVAALFGMSYGLNQGGEVRVDVLFDRFSDRAKAFVDALSGLLLTLTSIAVMWLAFGYVEQSYAIGEGSPDPGGLPYRFLLKAALPAAFFLLAVQAFAMTLRAIVRFVKGAPPPTHIHPDLL